MPPPLPPPPQPIRGMHRRMGLLGALLLVGFVGTGLALQHPEGLGLDRRYVTNAAFVGWLGVAAPDPIAFVAGGRTLVGLGEFWVLDETPLDVYGDRLIGVVARENVLLAATPTEVLMLDGSGALVDRLPLPALATALGDDGRRVLAATQAGPFALDDAMTGWTRVESPVEALPSVQWSVPSEIDATTQTRLADLFLRRAVTWERALRELHSGRALGRYGPWLVDAAGVLLLALALTGLLLARQRS